MNGYQELVVKVPDEIVKLVKKKCKRMNLSIEMFTYYAVICFLERLETCRDEKDKNVFD